MVIKNRIQKLEQTLTPKITSALVGIHVPPHLSTIEREEVVTRVKELHPELSSDSLFLVMENEAKEFQNASIEELAQFATIDTTNHDEWVRSQSYKGE